MITSIIQTFSRRERVWAIIALIAACISGAYIFVAFINKVTYLAPATGGIYTEGIVGQVAFVNPVLASDGTPDEDVVSLTFANMLDLAESIKPSNNFQTWNVRLKAGATWQDGTPLTSDDVIFTVQTIKNPDTGSPLAHDWQNITPVYVSAREVQFQLTSPYAPFENLLRQLRPIPKKLFATIAPANIKLSAYNLQPIGSGPFKYKELSKKSNGFITSYTLVRNNQYQHIGPKPYIDGITIHFFENDIDLLNAFNMGIIDGFGTTNPLITDGIDINATIHDIPMMKYYAVFFNQNADPVLADSAVREALNVAIDRNALITNVFKGKATPEQGPIPLMENSTSTTSSSTSQQSPSTQAQQILTADGWTQGASGWQKTGKNGTQQILPTLTVPNVPILTNLAHELQNQWKAAGISISLQIVDPATLQSTIIQTRNYSMLLFGNVLLPDPDLFNFWASTQSYYPGLNLSLYSNTTVDNLIQSLKQIPSPSDARTQALQTLNNTITADLPALFLVSPQYIYVTRTNVQDISIPTISLPEDRFNNVTSWYLRTSRVFK